MSVVEIIRQINWHNEDNRIAAETLIADAKEYMERVEAHIYKGNEIRADMWMDNAEKQEKIQQLDRKRTQAHDQMLTSFGHFIDVLRNQPEFDESRYKFANRVQIADFVATIAFELFGLKPESQVEGSIRDELVEKLHEKEITIAQINDMVKNLASE